MVQIPIKRTIDRIPGGMMIVPLFLGAIIRTWKAGLLGVAYKPAAASATVLVATSVVVTAILVPIITAWWYRRMQARQPALAPAPAVQP